MDICLYTYSLSFVNNPRLHGEKEWNTVRGEQSYEAYFAYFNGEDEVPIKAKKGERVTIHIDFTNRNGGGFGYYLIDEKIEELA
ncbi:hypothetical protein AAHH67_03550 [Niallia circulans]